MFQYPIQIYNADGGRFLSKVYEDYRTNNLKWIESINKYLYNYDAKLSDDNTIAVFKNEEGYLLFLLEWS